MTSSRASLARGLNRLARQPSTELESLQRLWPAVRKQVERKRRHLLRAIPKDDPIRLQVDLLGPIKCASDETLHTQALAYAMDPQTGHQLAKHVVLSLLEFLRSKYPRSGAARVLRTARKAGARISVEPEYRYRVEGFRHKSAARSDIWIEIQGAKRSAVMVLENKIKAAESDGQLSWYERKAAAWCKARGHNRFLLIFLSREGQAATTYEKRRWVALSYLELASVLRKVWVEARPALGAQWLALYVASIMHGVLGINLKRHENFNLVDVQAYLGRRR
ncbi:MAG: PD-(D/E)XK nuclease family protein [Pseudomonadota bacterium]